MSTIKEEIAKALEEAGLYGPKPFRSKEAELWFWVLAASRLTDSEFDKLPVKVYTWINDATKAVNDRAPLNELFSKLTENDPSDTPIAPTDEHSVAFSD